MNERKYVRFIQTPDYDAGAVSERAKSILAADGVSLSGKKVFVLFNADRSFDRDDVGTHPEFVIGVVEAIASMKPASIHVADPTSFGSELSGTEFSRAQASRLGKSASIVPVERAKRAKITALPCLVQEEFGVPVEFKNCDFFIALPKLKTNLFTEMSTSVATMLYLLPSKGRLRFHDYRLNGKLADLYKAKRPDYVIYDAVVCGEGQGPLYTTPRTLGLMIGGSETLHVDAAAAHIAGIQPWRVDHLKLISDRESVPIGVKSIPVEPADALENKRPFRRAEWNIENLNESMRVIGGSKNYCSAGCVGLLRQSLEPWLENKDFPKSGLTIIVGAPIEPEKIKHGENTLVAGLCAEDFKNCGVFIHGCPPDPAEIEERLLKLLGTNEKMITRLARIAGAPKDIVADSVRANSFGVEQEGISLSTIARIAASKASKSARRNLRKLRRAVDKSFK